MPSRLRRLVLATLWIPAITQAATFTVDSTADAPDATLGDGLCHVIGGGCTLRAAIEEANALAGADVITFAGPLVINVGTTLPAISTPVVINGHAGGTRLDGGNLAGSNLHGLRFISGASGSVLRGLTITRFPGFGVVINGQNMAGSLTGLILAGNRIGTDGSDAGPDAGSAFTNQGGVLIYDRATDTLLGSEDANPAARNLIVANSTSAAVAISNASNTRVQGNYIGTNAAGSARRGTMEGIKVDGGASTIVDQNVIGALATGIRVSWDADDTFIQRNLIGVGTNGADIAGGNSGIGGSDEHGIHIVSINAASPRRTRIGGNQADEGNTIAYWGGNGIRLERASNAPELRRHEWLVNSIHSNGGLGVELIDTDAGTGADPFGAPPPTLNGGPRLPMFTSATGNAAGTHVSYELAGAPSVSYRVDFFANTACNNGPQYGEGQTWLGNDEIILGANGGYAGTVGLPAVSAGSYLTMIASRNYNDGQPMESSEFSMCAQVQAGPGGNPGGPDNKVAAVPTLGQLSVLLLSLSMAGAGAMQRRKRGSV
ncbi:IPTL-CTERM sorting domain-containing protein [Ottowia sp. VDI28]|uniref:IPTL-CTERM sorting domain-containing protein n=1 Tax=Ottowia sp. VDI28 TaxID=3133968 RepID=UPI003C2B6C5A